MGKYPYAIRKGSTVIIPKEPIIVKTTTFGVVEHFVSGQIGNRSAWIQIDYLRERGVQEQIRAMNDYDVLKHYEGKVWKAEIGWPSKDWIRKREKRLQVSRWYCVMREQALFERRRKLDAVGKECGTPKLSKH